MHTALALALIALALAAGFLGGQASVRAVPVAQAQIAVSPTPINWELECYRAATREAAYECLERHNLRPRSAAAPVLPAPTIPFNPLSVR